MFSASRMVMLMGEKNKDVMEATSLGQEHGLEARNKSIPCHNILNDVKGGTFVISKFGVKSCTRYSKMSTDFKRSYDAPLVSFCILISLSTLLTIPFHICLHLLCVQVSEQSANPHYLSTIFLLSHSPTGGKESTEYSLMKH